MVRGDGVVVVWCRESGRGKDKGKARLGKAVQGCARLGEAVQGWARHVRMGQCSTAMIHRALGNA